MTAGGIIHIVDDDEAVRDSLRVLLEASNYVVRTHDNASTFLSEVTGAAGCVLTDLHMPEINGLELQHRLHEQGSQLPVIVMTGRGEVGTAVRAMRAGAVDFLEKPFSGDTLRDAIGRALELGVFLSETVAKAAQAAARLATLTPREREVVDFLVSGLSNKAIGRELHTSPRTIEAHRARIVKKLGVHTLPELVRLTQAAEATPMVRGSVLLSEPAFIDRGRPAKNGYI